MRRLAEDLRARAGLRIGRRVPIGRAAEVVGSTPRMLRYRESLGLLAPPRGRGGHREYGERELLAAARAAELEQRYGVGPAELAFALRVLAEPSVAAEVRTFGQLVHRLAPPPVEALDFDAQKARRLLRLRG